MYIEQFNLLFLFCDELFMVCYQPILPLDIFQQLLNLKFITKKRYAAVIMACMYLQSSGKVLVNNTIVKSDEKA